MPQINCLKLNVTPCCPCITPEAENLKLIGSRGVNTISRWKTNLPADCHGITKQRRTNTVAFLQTESCSSMTLSKLQIKHRTPQQATYKNGCGRQPWNEIQQLQPLRSQAPHSNHQGLLHGEQLRGVHRFTARHRRGALEKHPLLHRVQKKNQEHFSVNFLCSDVQISPYNTN